MSVIQRGACSIGYFGSSITGNMFCTGQLFSYTGLCQGDGGGPVVDSSKTLLGIVLRRDHCTDSLRPEIVLRTSTLLTFIFDNS
jgi:trypsin